MELPLPNSLEPLSTALILILLTSLALLFLSRTSLTKSKSTGPRVQQLHIYPIKSCAEINVTSAKITPRGFQHDRIFQVVAKSEDENNNNNNDGDSWNFCTPRDKKYEKLFHVKPSLVYGASCLKLASSQVQSREHVRTADFVLLKLAGAATTPISATVQGGETVSLQDYGDNAAGWLQRATGIEGCRLVGIGQEYVRNVQVNPDQGEDIPTNNNEGEEDDDVPVSLADEAPFLLTSQESLDDLNKRLVSSGKEAIDMRRFRPNIVISGLKPWEEDTLKRVKIGQSEFHVWQRCGRCTMTTIDRDNLKRCGEPLNTLSTFRERDHGQRNFGMHLIPVTKKDGDASGAKISIGDKIEILEYDEERKTEWTRLFSKQQKVEFI